MKVESSKQIAGALCLTFLLLYVFLSPTKDIDPLVGPQYWTEGINKETGLGTYRVWTSADFLGGDLAFAEAKNIEACLYACDEHKECLYVSWINNLCYLKDSPTQFQFFDKRPHLYTAKRTQVKPLVGDSWHDASVIDSSKSSFRLFEDSEFSGEIARQVTLSTVDLCVKHCESDADCLFFTYTKQTCSIISKTATMTKVSVPGSKAGMKVRMKDVPDPLVKHHWAKGGERETKFATYQTWASCQFSGHDIGAVKAKNLEACLEACDKEIFCRHVTLVGQECMLKGWSPDHFEILNGRSDVWSAKQIATKQPTRYLKDPTKADLHQDMLVGAVFDEGYDAESKFSRYRLWEGFDFQGGDLHSTTFALESYTLDACLEACDHNVDCNYVVVIVGKECWLKRQPIELTRMVDKKLQVYAGMKLGRVGKPGLDANTLKRDARQPTSLPREIPSAGQIQDLQSVVLNNLALIGVVIVLIGVFALLVLYLSKVRAAFYVNELGY